MGGKIEKKGIEAITVKIRRVVTFEKGGSYD